MVKKLQTMELHHIGVKVPNLAIAIEEYRELGFEEFGESRYIHSRGIVVQWMLNDNFERIELISPQNHQADVNLAPMHFAYYGPKAESRNFVVELASKLELEGRGKWERIPELGMNVFFFSGPAGEQLELVKL